MRPVISALMVVTVPLLMVACGSAGEEGTPSPGAPTPSTAAEATAIALADADNGRTVTVRLGQKVQLTLGSTYWSAPMSSDAAVLRLIGPVTVTPSPGCVPGQGCGAVVATLEAVGTGQSDVTSSRTSCGEARGCTAAEGSFRVTIVVTS